MGEKHVQRDEKLMKAAINAAAALGAIYEWVDRVEANGGTGCISGIAEAHAMISSMKKNRSRFDKLIMAPLQEEVEARRTGAGK